MSMISSLPLPKQDKTDEQPFKLFVSESLPQNKFNVAPKERRTDTETGIVFDSEMELKVWRYLKQFIPPEHLHRQVPFELLPKFEFGDDTIQPITLVVDFVLGPLPFTAQSLVLDAKGMSTPDFLLKRKMFLYRYRMPLLLTAGVLARRKPKPGTIPKKEKKGAKARIPANTIVALYRERFQKPIQ